MGVKATLKSKNTWIGAAIGYFAGSWIVSTAKGLARKA
jgi:hypothetical protein